MRIFLGGSKGLVLYEDEELTQIHSESLLCAVRPSSTRLLTGTESGSIVVCEGNGDSHVAIKDLGQGVQSLAISSNGTIYAGLIPAGLWMSKDQGETWSEVPSLAQAPGHEAWSAPWGIPLLSCIATHPKDAKTIFCGVEVGGI